MLRDPSSEKELRAETVRLAVAAWKGSHRTPPKVTVRFTKKTYTTGRCWRDRLHLSVPRGASVPQVIALICHEVAHWLAPADADHGKPWREAFRACLALYDAPLDDLGGTKFDVDDRARTALAARLRLPQVGAVPADADAPVVGVVDPEKREDVARRVAKYLALAANNTNEHEAATAATRAERLLRAYRLTMEDVAATERDSTDPVTHILVCQGTRRRVDWRITLGFDLSRVVGCYALSMSWTRCEEHPGEFHSAMRFIGRRSTVSVCGHIYAFLLREIESVAVAATARYAAERGGKLDEVGHAIEQAKDGMHGEQEVGRGPHMDGSLSRKGTGSPEWWAHHKRLQEAREEAEKWDSPPRAWGTSFRSGAAKAAVKRLRQDRERDEATTTFGTTALVLARRDYAEAETWAHAHLSIGSSWSGGSSARSASGRSAGEAAGHSIRVDNALAAKGGGGTKLLTG